VFLEQDSIHTNSTLECGQVCQPIFKLPFGINFDSEEYANKTFLRWIRSSFITPTKAPFIYISTVLQCSYMFHHHLCYHQGDLHPDYKSNSY